MKAEELRKAFLDFFAARGHRVMPSSSLIPADPTTLFTSAGMQQFVPYWRGEAPPPARRITTCQKCAREKDIDQVGHTPGHHTFFEMLGNFSIGDYFKREAIEWGWEFTTQVLKLPKERFWITVYPEDEEAVAIWRDEIGIPADRIIRLEDNWWGPVGATGPCGPDSELHYDYGPDGRGCGQPDCNPGHDCGRFIELWNLVFPQYNKLADGTLSPLANRGIDTGMGLERTTIVLQGVRNSFETDLFQPIMDYLKQIVQEVNPSFAYGKDEIADHALRVMADHSRSVTFLVSDGVMPSNEGRGYNLRRFLRRADLFARKLEVHQPFLHRVVPVVAETMQSAYPELLERQEFVVKVVHAEEERFQATLEQGSLLLERALEELRRSGQRHVPGATVFELYDTYGFPRELTAESAREAGFEIDEAGFTAAMEEQRTRSRASWSAVGHQDLGGVYAPFVGQTEFIGYGTTQSSATVLGLVRDTNRVESASADEEVEAVLDHTPFYAEAGGQVGDMGTFEWPEGKAEVLDTHQPMDGVIAHRLRIVSGELQAGIEVTATVDGVRRQAIARAHTATHLLHHALRLVLGEHATQSGSLVEPDRLRFDFSHFQAMTPEQVAQVEELVNLRIMEDHPAGARVTTLAEARAAGAMALFGEKYGEQVRMVEVGEFSRELCGGTHLHRSGEIGSCKLLGEGSVGAGLRRIEAVTGLSALRWVRQQHEALAQAAQLLHVAPEEVPTRIGQLLSEVREVEKKAQAAQARTASGLMNELLTEAKAVNDFHLIARQVPALSADALRELADSLVSKLGSAVVVLGTASDGKVLLVSKVSKDLVARGLHAGNLVGQVARATGGGGGGRPDFAQAGGRHPEQLDSALALVEEIVRKI